MSLNFVDKVKQLKKESNWSSDFSPISENPFSISVLVIQVCLGVTVYSQRRLHILEKQLNLIYEMV